ncbi:MAG: RagB/SusD family nutrient uptake outer membrane protein [Prevotella sp.]|nr:RagB/SusD family nutrient uptake outer membrane protein [Prevotella sp.]
MNKIKKYIIIGIMPLLTGCSDFLDLVPEEDITTVETLFEQRTSVEEWEADCHSFIRSISTPQGNLGLTASDELVGNKLMRTGLSSPINGLLIGDGLQSVQQPYGNIWSNTGYFLAIRFCNTFIEKAITCYNMSELEKKQWTAEVKALKAYLYFEMVRRYGPIILVPENLPTDTDVESMKQPRRPLDECFDAIVSLIDEAIADGLLPKSQKPASHSAYFCRESAFALKAKVLVYQASPFYNGNKTYSSFKNKQGEQLFPSEYDAEKWRKAAEACDEAVKECEAAGYALNTGTTSKATKLLNTMYDLEQRVEAPAYNNDEGLFYVRYANTGYYWPYKLHAYTLPRFQSSDNTMYNSSCYGSLSPTIKMVEMYYTDRGLPIDEDPNWDYNSRYAGMSRETDIAKYEGVIPENTPVLNLHLRREPRFYADIASDRTYWQLGPAKVKTSDPDYNLEVKAYRNERFGTQSSTIQEDIPQNISGYWLKKHLYSTIKTRSYSNDYVAKGDDPWAVMRLAELYLLQAEAWNEVEGPTQKVYDAINKVRNRAGIPDVEESWARSYHPEKVKEKSGMREIIKQETNIELAFEGHRFWNLRRWNEAQVLGEPLKGWNVVATTAEGFYNNWQGPIEVWSKRKFDNPRDYLWPIKSEEVMISGVVQNPGW